MSKEPGLPLFSGCGMDSWRTETKKVKVRVAAAGNSEADGNENVKKNNRFKKNNNFARASRFFVHFFARFCTTTM